MNIIKYLFNWQYRYFTKKKRGVQKSILDLEFKRFKTLEIREEVRAEYDNQKNKLSLVDQKLKAELTVPTISEDEKKRLEDQVVLINKDMERFEEQMRLLDIDVNGSKQTNEFPDGVSGITSQIEAFMELEGMLDSYIKNF